MAKRDRKRQNIPREPNGRASRKKAHVQQFEEMTEREAKEVMIKARMRHTGLPECYVDLTDAGRPNAGTAHGILLLSEQITREQWDAAEWWLRRRNEWLRAISAPGGHVDIPDAPPNPDPKAYQAWCKSVRDLWTEVSDCLREARIQSRSPILAALDHILARDLALEHMIPDLRLGLNAIHRQFLSARRQAA